MKKKILSLTLVVCLLAIAVVGGTLAYFTDDDDATNTFTVGNVQIDLIEPAWDEIEGTTGTGQEDAPEVYPGEALAKDPQVVNEGKNPCFVRVKVTGLDSLINAQLSDEKIGLRDVSNKWKLHSDGYYYYNEILPAGETTEALFTHILMPTDLVNDLSGVDYDVEVFAQAVQAQGANGLNWAGVQGIQGDVVELAKWFNTCGMDAPVVTP